MTASVVPTGSRPIISNDLLNRVVDVLAAAPGRDAAEIRGELRALADGLVGHRIDLVTDTESYDGRCTHNALIRIADGRTVSVSVSDPVGLPWPLRGVARAREYDLLRVDGVTMPVQEAMACIDAMFDDRHLLRTLIDACLIGDAIDRLGVTVTDDERRSAAVSFRRSHGLRSVADTHRWLADRSLSAEQFGQLIEQRAKVDRLRRIMVGDRVDAVLADTDPTAGDPVIDLVQIAWIRPEAGAEPDFALLAADPLRAVVQTRREHRAAGLECWSPADVPARFAPLLSAEVGAPARLPGEPPVLAVVVDRSAAESTAQRRERLTRRLFDEWLAARRRQARVEWFWGNETRTAAARWPDS